MLNLGIQIGRGTIRRILRDHLIEPAPVRGRQVPWSVFLKAHWKAIAASDFFTVEVWSFKVRRLEDGFPEWKAAGLAVE